jgi:hypothetical protein
MRDFNEIKTALWLPNSTAILYSFSRNEYIVKNIGNIDSEKVHSLAELFNRYRTEPVIQPSMMIGIHTRHRSPVLLTDLLSSAVNSSGLQSIVNNLCEQAKVYSDVHHYKASGSVKKINFEVTYKILKPSQAVTPLVSYYFEINGSRYRDTHIFQQSSSVGVFTDTFEYVLDDTQKADMYISYNKFVLDYGSNTYIDNAEILSFKPTDEWKDAGKKGEKVLHKFSYVVNIFANPAVLKVYAKNDAIEKCSLDADKYVDTDLNKVVYTVSYANGSTATIDYWSYDENEELVVYQNLNCTLGEKTQSW